MSSKKAQNGQGNRKKEISQPTIITLVDFGMPLEEQKDNLKIFVSNTFLKKLRKTLCIKNLALHILYF